MAKKSESTNVGERSAKREDSPIVRGNIDRQVVVSPSFVSIYANDTQVQTTPWDVRLTLGEMSVDAVDGVRTVNVRELAEVRMSLQHVKRVVKILSSQLKVYEESFGTIPQPSDD